MDQPVLQGVQHLTVLLTQLPEGGREEEAQLAGAHVVAILQGHLVHIHHRPQLCAVLLLRVHNLLHRLATLGCKQLTQNAS